jgi:hypothetical protein
MHISKGRLHAFRKLSNDKLPDTDCHADLRRELVEKEILKEEPLCISIAWDWMYRGVTPDGINREVVTALECAALNRKHTKLSLAIPEQSLLHMSKVLAPPTCRFPSLARNIQLGHIADDDASKPYAPSKEIISRGILPGLRYVIEDHLNSMKQTRLDVVAQCSGNERDFVSIAERPKSHEHPKECRLDPYGNSDFFCKLCHKELSNVYYECDGCRKLLAKVFNICQLCHTERRYKITVQMHCKDKMRDSRVNHIGKCPNYDVPMTLLRLL